MASSSWSLLPSCWPQLCSHNLRRVQIAYSPVERPNYHFQGSLFETWTTLGFRVNKGHQRKPRQRKPSGERETGSLLKSTLLKSTLLKPTLQYAASDYSNLISVAVINAMTKTNHKKRGHIWFTLPGHNSSLREVGSWPTVGGTMLTQVGMGYIRKQANHELGIVLVVILCGFFLSSCSCFLVLCIYLCKSDQRWWLL